jgi:hypothetical protein
VATSNDRNEKTNNYKMEDKKINKLHFLYITGILIAIIILLSTAKFGSNDNLIAYLSFALTVTSLFLSLLAIIYAYISNSTFGDTISSLNKSSIDISNNSKNLETITKTLDEKFEKLPQFLKALESKVDWTNAYLYDQYERSQTAPQEPLDQEISEDYIDNFINYSSTMGLYALYAVYLSWKNKKPFTLKQLYDNVELLSMEYTMGFLTSVSSFGVFTRSDYSDKWTITDFNSRIAETITNAVEERARKEKEDEKANYLETQIKKLRIYFNEQKGKS